MRVNSVDLANGVNGKHKIDWDVFLDIRKTYNLKMGMGDLFKEFWTSKYLFAIKLLVLSLNMAIHSSR